MALDRRRVSAKWHRVWSVLGLCALVCSGVWIAQPETADASGFASARFGGEHGNPTEINPMSLYYNPGGIGFAKGTDLTLDLSLVWRTATYERFAESVDYNQDTNPNIGQGQLNNFLVSPMVGVTSDFGLDIPLVFGAAFYVPFGGQSVWDRNSEFEGNTEYPGAVDGPQRWYAIDGTIRTMAFTGGAAYRIESARLSLGLTGSLMLNEVSTIRARNADKTDNPVSEGRTFVEASSTDFNIGAGALWEAIEKKMWVGLSYQSRPNLTGDVVMSGTMKQYLSANEERDVKFYQQMPDVLRAGVRYRPNQNLELRLFGDVTFWSVFESQCLLNSDVADEDVATACEVDPNTGAQKNTEFKVDAVLLRNWENAFGVRGGVSYWLMDRDLELIAGTGFDGNAIPDNRLEPAFMDMNKYTASLGVSYWIYKRKFKLMVTGTNVFYEDRDTKGVDTANALVDDGTFTTSRQPSSAGVYTQNIFLLNTNVRVNF